MTVIKNADGTTTITASTEEAHRLWVASQSLALNGEDDGRLTIEEAGEHAKDAETLWAGDPGIAAEAMRR